MNVPRIEDCSLDAPGVPELSRYANRLRDALVELSEEVKELRSSRDRAKATPEREPEPVLDPVPFSPVSFPVPAPAPIIVGGS